MRVRWHTNEIEGPFRSWQESCIYSNEGNRHATLVYRLHVTATVKSALYTVCLVHVGVCRQRRYVEIICNNRIVSPITCTTNVKFNSTIINLCFGSVDKLYPIGKQIWKRKLAILLFDMFFTYILRSKHFHQFRSMKEVYNLYNIESFKVWFKAYLTTKYLLKHGRDLV